LLIVAFEIDRHLSLAVLPGAGNAHKFERGGVVTFGQHMREPQEHLTAIQNAPVEDIIFI
jgi:hypothetical protein